ncbi:cytochrome c oxidase assembly protein [Salaquimonas pukyongi]|uniref:cytochrome c oxidase assembly protein n=1 Tax=Salaquimonas pukyongi TaxID=2712698 RepID=UPI00096BC41A|nr:cytochrome c oxidase assembly protein [Salaquimonas pukyongi]
MKPEAEIPARTAGSANRRVVVACVSAVVFMTGMAYAAVPLYDLFCRVTGYGGTTQLAVNSEGIRIIDQEIKVRFDANTQKGLAWEFAPVERGVTIKLGETREIAYRAKNLGSKPLTATATFNVTPQSAGAYFNKIECFCFTKTTLQPGEEMIMPVVFFVDPDLAETEETKDIRTITLSYTFFKQEAEEKPLAVLDSPSRKETGGEAENRL